ALLAFRRISEALGNSSWYLRMLRDSSSAAERLCELIAQSKYVTELILQNPAAVQWLDDTSQLQPTSAEALREELAQITTRHSEPAAAAEVFRAVRRRELLRLAIAQILNTAADASIAQGITDVYVTLLEALTQMLLIEKPFPFAIIAMGRFGGAEL